MNGIDRAPAHVFCRNFLRVGFGVACLLAAVWAAPAAQAQYVDTGLVLNNSFEANAVPAYPGYTGTINNWTLGVPNHIINDATGPFYDPTRGAIPNGTRVYGHQGAGDISQNIAGLVNGRAYRLDFRVNLRNCCGASPSIQFRASLGTQVLYGPTTHVSGTSWTLVSVPFQYNSTWGNTLKFDFLNPVSDATALMDYVQILVAPQYTVGYAANPAAGGVVTGPANINYSGTSGSSITLSATANAGYTRTGVTATNGTIAAAGGNNFTLSGVTANTTVTGNFTPNTYTVAFNSQGGSAVANKVVTFDAAYGALTTPTRTGYTFNGWFTSGTGGTQVTAATTVTTASNHTLFAQWTANTYTVTFDSQGGSAVANKVVTFDAAYGALSTPTRTGFSFDGWFTLASGGTQVTAATVVTVTSNHTLFAQWTDTENPVANCATPTVQLDAAGTVTVTVAEIDGGSTDNVGITGTTIDGGATVVFTCADVGSQTVVLRVEDAAGNFDTCNASVLVEDSVDPTVVCQNVTRNMSAGVPVTAADVDNGSSDACGIASVVLQGGDIALDCFQLGTQSVTLVVTDNNGNSANCTTATVTIVDDIPPVLTPVAGPTAGVAIGSTFGDPGATATDNCGVSATPVGALIAGTIDTSTPGNMWTIQYTVSDDAGNPATPVQTVFTVSNDTVAPVISGAGTDITVSCGTTLTNGAALAGVTATDDVDGPVAVTVDLSGLPSPLTPSGSPYTIMYSATDAATNVGMANRNVVVLDDCTLAVSAVSPLVTAVEVDGTDVTLEIGVTGAVGTPMYQWYFVDGANPPAIIPGALGPIHILTAEPGTYGSYYCVVTDDVTSVTSPSFTVQSANAVPVGGALALSLLTIMSAVGGASALRKRKQ